MVLIDQPLVFSVAHTSLDDIEDALLAYSPKLRKKIEEGLKDIRAGRTMVLSNYKTKRNRNKVRGA